MLGISVWAAGASGDWPGRWGAEFDMAIQSSIDRGKVPGVVLHVEHAGESYHRAYGWRGVTPVVEEMTEETIFDVASLTKVVATTPSIMRLVEEGKIDLDAPVSRYLDEFAGEGREAVSVRHLMTHNSGLPAGIKFVAEEPWSGYDEGIARACREPLEYVPGTQFVYSDINFILLGEIIRRVSGQRVDAFAGEHVFRPLGMEATGFRPAPALRGRIAPTTLEPDGKQLRGVVHDPTSRRMGGVCGHAGLFSTAHDLARYCRMLLDGGVLDGRRVLGEATVAAMTAVQSPPEVAAKRGLGWDLDSRFSSQRGDFFPAGSFGHTGWTGTSLWIDPASQTFVVFLSNRNHPSEAGVVTTLRGRVGTLAAQSAADWQTVALPGLTLPWPAPRGLPVIENIPAPVRTGIDVLEGENFRSLAGRRIGLITNHTGIDRTRVATIDRLKAAPNVQLLALFSPEHGIRGALDEPKITDSTDEKTGLPVISLYGERRAPTPGQLAALDTLVFDIQDIGCRFYTYISTMGACHGGAAKEGKRFFVLDRPNPIGGTHRRRPDARRAGAASPAAHPIPLRHGMTVGELARLFNAERKWPLDLQVVKCEGWTRPQLFDETGLPWVNPSPNMRSLAAAVLYPGDRHAGVYQPQRRPRHRHAIRDFRRAMDR